MNDARNRSRPDVACRLHSYNLRNRASDVRHNVGAHVQTCPGYDLGSNPGLPVHSRMIYHYATRRHSILLTHATGRTFIHTAVDIWNSLPDNVVGRITDNNLQSFKTRAHRHLLSTTRTSASLSTYEKECGKVKHTALPAD
ncbi:hypothetical protein Bbelb_028620 [Branchiostoma belcheri]|nr:hypothetical protein Bbelb_028620 [Branchiostoma belcheri]